MTPEELLAALDLPTGCRIGRRVPRTVWPEGLGACADSIAELRWEAVLKPENTGIAADAEAIELQILSLRLPPPGKGMASPETAAARLHRCIPYPVFLILAQEGIPPAISLTDAPLCPLPDDEATTVWLLRLALSRQPRSSLAAVYRGWVAATEALRAARIAGTAAAGAAASMENIPPEAIATRRQALEDHDRLEREIARLRAQAGKEKHLGRRAELNLRLQQLQSEFAATRARL